MLVSILPVKLYFDTVFYMSLEKKYFDLMGEEL